MSDFVLGTFRATERDQVEGACARAVEAAVGEVVAGKEIAAVGGGGKRRKGKKARKQADG